MGHRRGPAIDVHPIGDHHQPFRRDPKALQHIGLQLGENNDLVVSGQGRCVQLIGQLLGSRRDVAQP